MCSKFAYPLGHVASGNTTVLLKKGQIIPNVAFTCFFLH